MRPLAIGTEHAWSPVPDRSHTASAIGNPGVHVVSTPAIIGFLEQTAHRLIEPSYEAGEASVGTGVNIRHRAAAYPGSALDCTARLERIDGRRLTFAVAARQNGTLVMDGTHERAVIRLDRFMGDAPSSQDTAPPRLTFWFDLHSPWCYLAATRIGDLARAHGATLEWVPFQLPRLIEAIGGRQPLTENERFVDWYRADLADWAGIEGVPIAYHPDYPLPNARALRVCLLARDRGLIAPVALALFRAYWSEAANITDPGVLGRIAAGAGLDADEAAAAALSREFKARLEAQTQAAIECGLFGAPTIECDGKLYFGYDRLGLLERHLGRRADAADVANQDGQGTT